jgi:hypothetical protein
MGIGSGQDDLNLRPIIMMPEEQLIFLYNVMRKFLEYVNGVDPDKR